MLEHSLHRALVGFSVARDAHLQFERRRLDDREIMLRECKEDHPARVRNVERRSFIAGEEESFDNRKIGAHLGEDPLEIFEDLSEALWQGSVWCRFDRQTIADTQIMR